MAESSTGGVIAAAGIQALGNAAVSVAANRRQFKYQKEAMQLQDEYNRKLWDYQNAYNTPQQQMERLKAAGLNPYLIYGNGAANAGNAGPLPGLDIPSREAARPELPDVASRYLNARQADAQYAATRQAIESAKTKQSLDAVKTSLESLKLMREQNRSKNYAALNQAEKRTQQLIVMRLEEMWNNEGLKGQLMTQMHGQRSEMFKAQLTSQNLENTFKQYRNQLAKYGISSADHPLLRTFIQAANRMNVPLDELLQQGVNKLKYLYD